MLVVDILATFYICSIVLLNHEELSHRKQFLFDLVLSQCSLTISLLKYYLDILPLPFVR